MLQQPYHAKRSASHKAISARPQLAFLRESASVHVFFRTNKVDKRGFVKMFWKRQLQNHAVYVNVFVEIAYRASHLVKSAVLRQFAQKRLDAHFVASLDFVAHVHLRCGIVPNQNHSQTDLHARLLLKFQSLGFYLFTRLLRHEFSVNDLHI